MKLCGAVGVGAFEDPECADHERLLVVVRLLVGIILDHQVEDIIVLEHLTFGYFEQFLQRASPVGDLTRRADGTLRVLIRRSKSDPFGEGRLAFTSQRTADFIEKWLSWRGPHISWLFCPIYQGKVLNRSLEITTVKRLIKNATRRSGLSPSEINALSGHSMRLGAAQDLLCAGYDTAAIMRVGGWKSVNILARYLEKAEHNVWKNA